MESKAFAWNVTLKVRERCRSSLFQHLCQRVFVCPRVRAWGLWLLYEPGLDTSVCVAACAHPQGVFRHSSSIHLLSNWPPEGQWAGRRLTSWSRQWPLAPSLLTALRGHCCLSTFTIPPVISLPSTSLHVFLKLRSHLRLDVPPFLCRCLFLISSHLLLPSILTHSSIWLFANQSTPRTLLKCLQAVWYFCRVWCGGI